MASWKEVNVIVTGGAGFLGANLVRMLIRRGASVSVLVRPDSGLWRLEQARSSINILSVDLLNREAVREALRRIQPEIVFHLAVGRMNSYDMVSSIVLGTYHLLEALEECVRLRKLIYTGSSLEYGKKTVPLEESRLPEPDTFYGACKAAATLLIQQKASLGLPAVILRLFSVYGYWEALHRLIPTAILACLDGREILLTERGYRRDFVFVDDVLDAILLAAERQEAVGQVLNVASGVQSTNETAVDLIQEILGTCVPVRYGKYPARVTDTTYWVGNPDRAENVLNWKPRTDLRTGLEKTIEWFKINRHFWSPAEARLQ